MQLELLSCLPPKTTRYPPLLFVHGAYSAAWCWEKYFLPYFAKQGYPSYALSLRGHGASAGHAQLPFASLANYVADVQHIIQHLPQPPILIGHSMGGLIVQKYMASGHPYQAIVLMASVPPTGLWLSSFYLSITSPTLWWQLGLIQNISLKFTTPFLARKLLFSETMPDHLILDYLNLTQNESQRAIMDMFGLDLPQQKPPHFNSPILILGAAQDALFPRPLIQQTASIYDQKPLILPNLAHLMMLDLNWQTAADTIINWLHNHLK